MGPDTFIMGSFSSPASFADPELDEKRCVDLTL
jgi:hypothetical protein